MANGTREHHSHPQASPPGPGLGLDLRTPAPLCGHTQQVPGHRTRLPRGSPHPCLSPGVTLPPGTLQGPRRTLPVKGVGEDGIHVHTDPAQSWVPAAVDTPSGAGHALCPSLLLLSSALCPCPPHLPRGSRSGKSPVACDAGDGHTGAAESIVRWASRVLLGCGGGVGPRGHLRCQP